jgi:tetratricopeptide (TPR) repeat protein
MAQDPEKLYKSGYQAFESADYDKAIRLAADCMARADINSYWYPGALALRCWAANFAGQAEQVIRDAYVLLSIDSGDDKMWFDGTALLNLGLLRRHKGDAGESEILFQFAAERFGAYQIEAGQPPEWRFIRDLFVASCTWAALSTVDKFNELAGELNGHQAAKGEVGHIQRAIALYKRAAEGNDVRDEAEKATGNGVSRTFVALLLL